MHRSGLIGKGQQASPVEFRCCCSSACALLVHVLALVLVLFMKLVLVIALVLVRDLAFFPW